MGRHETRESRRTHLSVEPLPSSEVKPIRRALELCARRLDTGHLLIGSVYIMILIRIRFVCLASSSKSPDYHVI